MKLFIFKANALIKIITLMPFLLIVGCKGQKDFLNPFQEKIEKKKGLFNLLDDYPALKSFFSNAEPNQFNIKLGESLSFYPEAGLGGMRSLEVLTLNPNAKLRELLLDISSLMQRIRTYDSSSYNQVTNLVERIRQYPEPFLENIIPLTHNGLKKLYLENTNFDLEQDILEIANSLQKQDTIDLFKELENFLYKTIILNANARTAVEKLTQSLLIFSGNTENIRKRLPELLYNFGNVLGSRVGYSQKSSDKVIKELIVNLENYTTSKTGSETNNIYDDIAVYSDTTYKNYPSRVDFILIELFKSIRKLILPANNEVKDSNKDILEEFIKTVSNLGFSIQNSDESLLNLLKNDFQGKSRTNDPSTQYSGRFSGLEALAYMVALGRHFGYYYQDLNCPSSTTPIRIISESNGFLTVGDAITALRSKNDCTDLGSAKIFKEFNVSGEIFRNGNVFKYNLNTPALCLLEGNSKGDINCIDFNGDNVIDADPIYAQTLPWVFGWIVKVLFEGEGPFYANTLTSFSDTWTTSSYKIKVRNGDFAGLGGIKNPSGSGSFYTIREIPIPNRQANSEEEAFYKNLLWLLYYKRFVIVMPIQAIIGSGVLGSSSVKDAIYVTIIANGLKGLMNVKPYCSSGSSLCDKIDNGKWLLSGKRIKTYNQIGDLDLSDTAWSDVPGDAVMLVEVWGCDVLSTCSYGFSGDNPENGEILYGTVYNSVLFPKNGGDFYGAIPPALSTLFPIMERLAFITDQQVTFENINTYWEKRNTLTPVVASLIKVLKDQTQSINDGNSSNDINAYNLMIDLLIPLIKNYIFVGNDPYQKSLTNDDVMITLFRTLGYRADNTTSIRNPELSSVYYYPDAEYVFGSTRVGYRSLLSLLIENQPRYYDGLLSMIASSHLLDETFNLLQELGKSEFDNNRQLFTSGIKQFLAEVKLNSETPLPSQYNIEQSINDLYQKLAEYPDTRNSNLSSEDWKDITEIVDLGWKVFSKSSEYNISSKVGFLLKIIQDIQIQSIEISAFYNVIAGILIDDSNNQSYQLTNLITNNLPYILTNTAKYTRSLIGIMAGISKPNAFGNYFMTNLKSSYHTKEILYDLERFLASNEVQSYGPSEEAILYQLGSLIKHLADIKEQGRKTGIMGYSFEDKWNQIEVPDTYFDTISNILTN
ncbi:MAG: hypothetical protein ACK4UJ_12290 [Leptonema sp. (in: bacteria)]